MLSKKIIFILCIVVIAASLIFAGCSKTDQESVESEASSNNPDIRIIELEEKDPPDIAYSEWASISEGEYIKRSVIIFKGKIVDKKEYVFEEKVSNKFTAEYYKTVYTLRISDIYYLDDKNLEIGDTIKVMSPITSHNWDLGAIQMEKNQEFILFAGLVRDMETAKGKIKLTDLAKYYIGNPWRPIISVKEDSFEMDVVFESLSKNATTEERKISDNYSKEILVRSDESFISDLKELINKYKNK